MIIPVAASAVEKPVAAQKLKAASVELEAAFLAEMLKSAGLGEARQSLGGGAGEDQFASFLVQQQAQQMARSGGIGLSESLFNAMMDMFSPFKDVLKHNGMDYNSFYLFSLLNCVKYRLLKNILNH